MKYRTTNLEQSKKLAGLGVNQRIDVKDCYYYNNQFCTFLYDENDLFEDAGNQGVGNHFNYEEGAFFELSNCTKKRSGFFKAFDGAQIDEMLPLLIDQHELSPIRINSNTLSYCYYNHQDNTVIEDLRARGETKLEAKANLLIKLLENKVIALNNKSLATS